MRRIAWLCLLVLVGGCVPRTQIKVPSLTGVVVDGESGRPLAGVDVSGLRVTGDDGTFAFPAEGVKQVTAVAAPGAGWPVRRTVTLHKSGYRDTTCTVTNMSIFPEDNRATIPLMRVAHATALTLGPQRLRIAGTDIRCSVFVGSEVVFEGTAYTVDGAERVNDGDAEFVRYSLRDGNGRRVVALDHEVRLKNLSLEPRHR